MMSAASPNDGKVEENAIVARFLWKKDQSPEKMRRWVVGDKSLKKSQVKSNLQSMVLLLTFHSHVHLPR